MVCPGGKPGGLSGVSGYRESQEEGEHFSDQILLQ